MSDSVPTNPNSNPNSQMMGGRRHRRKGHKTRKEPNVLKSWRKFVRKVQHEEHLSYPKAMKRASQRKSEWQRGGGEDDVDEQNTGTTTTSTGGRRRRSRKQRGGNAPAPSSAPASVDGFDENWTKYGSVSVGGSRKRRRHRR